MTYHVTIRTVLNVRFNVLTFCAQINTQKSTYAQNEQDVRFFQFKLTKSTLLIAKMHCTIVKNITRAFCAHKIAYLRLLNA